MKQCKRFWMALVAAMTSAAAFAGPAGQPGESAYLSDVRQLTFDGRRSGEGYFNADGSKLIFQSEREEGNPFYQIYLMDLETGDTHRVSPGYGKTTCAWTHPSGEKVLFASTHADPESKALQQAELDFRASGQARRYAWDYDEHFDIYEAAPDGSDLNNLTNVRGYDAEGSYSPDGEWIAFASNRHAYTEALSEEDAETFDMDKSYLMDIYLMRSDGSDVKRLTTTPGYDGGPFFSPDGSRIVWRRFAPNGATAEIYTMDLDGSDQRRITDLGVMSWAPYYHPSGDYIIFTNNSEGFGNFELHIVDTGGQREPVRVTFTDGFDGLPVFSPDGARLAWTSNRTSDGSSQIFIAEWNDAAARAALGLDDGGVQVSALLPEPDAVASAIRAQDMRVYVEALASETMQGRRTGTPGERLATAYLAEWFERIGLEPAGDDGTYFQEFEFTAGVSLGPDNLLRLGDGTAIEPDDTWRPLSFSRTGTIEPASVAFAGYGIQAPAGDGIEAYDSYVHLDVEGKWVMMFRYLPEEVTPEVRQHLAPFSDLRYKAMNARELGAAGIIVVSGPTSGVKDELVPLVFDSSAAETSIAAISISDALAERLLFEGGRTAGGAASLAELQAVLDSGEPSMGFQVEGVELAAEIDIVHEKRTGRNVLGRLESNRPDVETSVLVGAHIDHLGVGRGSGSLAHDDEAQGIHYGADDNASGVAGVIEIAQYLAAEKKKGLDMRRDVLFAGWSGEELGTLGADHFAKTFPGKQPTDPLTPEIAAVLNMDMIGRLDTALVVQGVGSSSIWPGEIERRNAPVGLPIVTQNDTYLPTDATVFYLRGVPFLNAFTGAHEDYHRPSDTPDKLNYEGAADIARFMALIARGLVTRETVPDYQEVERPENMEMRANLKAYLGTIPDYAESDVQGVRLAGVTKGAPADDAGLKMGDVIVELAGKTIENIYDYTFAIESLKVGEEVPIVVERAGERVPLTITPGSRD